MWKSFQENNNKDNENWEMAIWWTVGVFQLVIDKKLKNNGKTFVSMCVDGGLVWLFSYTFFCLLIKNAVDTQIWWGEKEKKDCSIILFSMDDDARQSFLNRNVKRCIYTHTRPGWHMEREWGDINSELMYHATGLEKTSSTSYYIAAIKTFPRVMTGIYTTGGLSLVPSNLCWTVV
jgi:hypothetical protein